MSNQSSAAAIDPTDYSSIDDLRNLPITRIAVDKLVEADSPRSAGENDDHVQVLTESEDILPPIIVNRNNMRVIDGMHRLHAAKRRGDAEVQVRLFDGDEASSFVLAVKMNTRHGLPLSLADRRSAATRIVTSYPHWSDRMIAEVTGLSGTTVTGIRARCPTGQSGQLDGRVGRDGRSRPVDPVQRRTLARGLIAANPDASLRRIAQLAMISPETARKIRAEVNSGKEGENSNTYGNVRALPRPHSSAIPLDEVPDPIALLRALKSDPAFRSTDNGRILLRMLSACEIIENHKNEFIQNIPAHCADWVSQVAILCSSAWQDLAKSIEEKQ